MSIYEVNILGDHLSSRSAAIPIRKEISKALEDNYDLINVNLNNIKIISRSFADEAIGVLVKLYGFDKVIEKIRLSGGSEYARRSIASAINIRKKELESEKFGK